MKQQKLKKTIKNLFTKNLSFTITFILFALYALAILALLLFCFNSSLKNGGNEFSANPYSFTRQPRFLNYISAFTDFQVGNSNFLMMTFNSIWYSVGAIVIKIVFSSMAAYIIAKYKFRGRNFLYSLAIVIMIIPIYGALPAQYKLFTTLSMKDSPLILLVQSCCFGTEFLIIYSFFASISWSYAESAFIDGAGHMQVFWKIMFPMALPAISAMAITGFVGIWNDYMFPLLYLEKSYPTLALGIYLFQRVNMYTANQPIYFAGIIISLLPVMILFLVFQNTIMSNIYAGGLKG